MRAFFISERKSFNVGSSDERFRLTTPKGERTRNRILLFVSRVCVCVRVCGEKSEVYRVDFTRLEKYENYNKCSKNDACFVSLSLCVHADDAFLNAKRSF